MRTGIVLLAASVLLPLVCAPAPARADEIRILTGEPGSSSAGGWGVASGASMRLENRPGLYASSGSAATYTFTPALPLATEYEVQVFNNCYSPRAHNAAHVIVHADGVATHLLEQDCALDPEVGRWRSLGSYRFEAGTGGSVTVQAAGADNVYVGVTGVRFLYEPAQGGNEPPELALSHSQVTVEAGGSVQLTASASDAEDGDLTAEIVWASPVGGGEGGSFFATAEGQSFDITVSVADSGGATASVVLPVTVTAVEPDPEPEPPAQGQYFDFACDDAALPAPLTGFVTNNPGALPRVGSRCGRYVADLLDNAGNVTTHFNQMQGRLDAVAATFPFVATARAVGIAPIGDAEAVHDVDGEAYVFAGLQVHHADLEDRNSAHVVVGQRGATRNTIEGKHTRDGVSEQDDVGAQAVPQGRADLRIVGNADRTLTVYWQPHAPGQPDAWIPYEAPGAGRPPGQLRGPSPDWGDTVYVGLITYAFGNQGVPFMGVADSLEVVPQ